MVSFILISTNLGWLDFTPGDIGLMCTFMGAGYFVIWLIFYLKYRAEPSPVFVP